MGCTTYWVHISPEWGPSGLLHIPSLDTVCYQDIHWCWQTSVLGSPWLVLLGTYSEHININNYTLYSAVINMLPIENIVPEDVLPPVYYPRQCLVCVYISCQVLVSDQWPPANGSTLPAGAIISGHNRVLAWDLDTGKCVRCWQCDMKIINIHHRCKDKELIHKWHQQYTTGKM